MSSDLVPKYKYGWGLAGVFLGLIGVSIFFGIEIFGRSSSTFSGSGELRYGEYYVETSRPFTSQLIRFTFYALLVPIVLSIVSFCRKESKLASWGALAFGLSPLFLYTLGSIVTPLFFYAVSFPILGILMFRLRAKHNN